MAEDTLIFRLTVRCDSDAFTPAAGRELARILRETARRIEYATDQDLWAYRTVRDINGNDIGRVGLKPEDPKGARGAGQ